MSVLDRFSALSTLQVRTISLLTVAVVVAADFLTPPEISFSALYILPIVFAGWYDNKGFGYFLAVMSALCWFAAERISGFPAPVMVHVWNALSRLAIFAGAIWMLSSIRRARLARLQDQLDRYARIMETAMEGVVALDKNGCVYHANPQAASLLGYEAMDLLGRHYSDLIMQPDSRKAIEDVRRQESGALPKRTELLFTRKDGTPLWALVHVSPTFDSEKKPDGTIVLMADISDRKLAEENLKQKFDEIAAMQNLSSVLVQSPDLSSRLSDALRAVLDGTKFDAGAIYLLNDGDSELFLQDMIGSQDGSAKIAQRWELGRGITGTVAATGEPQFLENADENPLIDPRMRAAEGIKAFAAIPLVAKGKVLGVLDILKREYHPFSPSEKSVLITFGSQIGVALENAILYEQAREREKQVRLLSINLMRIQEDERRKFARELHEGLAQLLTMMRVNAELALESLGNSGDTTQQRLLEVIGLVGEAEIEAKQISHDLRPAILDDFGLKAAIEVLARNFERRTGVFVDLHLPVVDIRFDSVIETTVYRIVQELLANVAKHAFATRVTIQVLVRGRVLALTVADNGKGFHADKILTTAAADGSHNGLRNMRERAESVKGMFHVESAPGKGTEFSIEIPCVLGEEEMIMQEQLAR